MPSSAMSPFTDKMHASPPLEENIGLLSLETTCVAVAPKPTSPPRWLARRLSTRLAPTLAAALHLLQRMMCFLLPSFATSYLLRPSHSFPAPSLRPTAFLDGLRGLAAWAVFNTHLSAILVKTSGAFFGHDGGNRELYKLPVVRLLYSGEFAVAAFFVISGFALSIGPVAAMGRFPRDAGSAMRKMAGTVLRRPVRLYAAPWVSMLIPFVLIRFDCFGRIDARRAQLERYVEGWNRANEWPARDVSFAAQLWDLGRCVMDMFVVLKDNYDADWGVAYNRVLWTIKLELRASFLLYLTHAALFFVRRRQRMVAVGGMIVMSWSVGSYDLPLFWSGYLLAEHFHRYTPAKGQSFGTLCQQLGHWVILVLGLVLGSFPIWKAEEVPYYSWLLRITPFPSPSPPLWWIGIGVTLVIYSISKLRIVQRVCECSVVQYLGTISFSIYLVHFWIVEIFGTLIFYDVWSIAGKNGDFPAVCGFFVAYALLLGFTIWVADVFHRVVDKPSVVLAAKLQNWIMQD